MGTSLLSSLWKFFLFSCCRRWASLIDSFLHSAKVFPKMLFAITRLLKPVYPGKGWSSSTYSLPSFETTLWSTQGLVLLDTLYLNSLVLLIVN